ncbi:MAG: M48 family metalloprotease [Pseudomonadota bacterium]
MTMSFPDRTSLSPLPYHHAIVDYLREHEPDVWNWASARATGTEQREALRAALLRDTYRIEPDAHPDVHATLNLALERLDIDAPATLYQSPGHDMNASIFYVPGEVHILLQGPLLERLSQADLLAVLGHELSHYLLWSRDEGRLLVADRILYDSLASASAHASHHETYRRFALHTELFADRGAAIAAGAVGPAICALVKIQTGIGNVDPGAYLRQAVEIEAKEEQASTAHSHPETFIRARALSLWWEGAHDMPAWLDARLHGPLALDRLDLPGQLHLQRLTRGFIVHFLADADLASEALLAQVRVMFPDWTGSEAAMAPSELTAALSPDVSGTALSTYLNALLIDLALADPDQQDSALLRAGRLARELGTFDGFEASLRRDAAMGKRELDKYKRQLDKESQA